ncbi:MAG: hypothetical protein JSV84_00540 [Gemmatimonadota bacterium]|nr:MAG: hypothetical protein JSV84_00540 [Gemmatimonadota bacterium]
MEADAHHHFVAGEIEGGHAAPLALGAEQRPELLVLQFHIPLLADLILHKGGDVPEWILKGPRHAVERRSDFET